MDEIFENMCRGILQSALYDSKRANEITLSYIGSGKRSIARQNRRDAGCTGSPCAKIFSETGPDGERIRWSCDEFPFATSSQGGSAAAILWVPQKDNSVLGSRWGQAVKGKEKDDQIRVKIKGTDCSKVPISRKISGDIGETTFDALAKRAGTILKNDTDSGAIYVDGAVYGDSSLGKVAMIIPFDIPEDFIGTFILNYTIAAGTIKSGSIVDDWGEDYGP